MVCKLVTSATLTKVYDWIFKGLLEIFPHPYELNIHDYPTEHTATTVLHVPWIQGVYVKNSGLDQLFWHFHYSYKEEAGKLVTIILYYKDTKESLTRVE